MIQARASVNAFEKQTARRTTSSAHDCLVTCDVEKDAVVAGGRLFKVNAAPVDSLVAQAGAIDHQVALARHLAVGECEAEVGAQAERRHFRPASAHGQRLAPGVEPEADVQQMR